MDAALGTRPAKTRKVKDNDIQGSMKKVEQGEQLNPGRLCTVVGGIKKAVPE